tara:strand:+ start:1505 stop:1840 length:336 start_codon:yes stop_codon:yes gene_type:complete
MEKHVGNISVDAGLCWLGDPCYFIQGLNPPKEISTWKAFVETIFANGKPAKPTIHSFKHASGVEGLGVCVSTGVGDGVYPVYANIEELPGWGKRVTSVRIEFIESEDNDEN